MLKRNLKRLHHGLIGHHDFFDIRSKRTEFTFDVLVSAFDVADILNFCCADGSKTGDDHCSSSAQIGCLDRCTGEMINSLDDGNAPVYGDLRAQPAQFVHITKAVVPYAFPPRDREARQSAAAYLSESRGAAWS